MPFTIPINPIVYAAGDGGIPTTVPFAELRGRMRGYEQTIVARGGFETMRARLTTTPEEALDWLNNGLMRSVVSYGPQAETCWEGVLLGVTATFGQERRSVSLEKMANRVGCKYSTRGGSPTTSSAVSDTFSQARYGIKDGLISASGITATAAANLAAMELGRRAWPVMTPASSVRTGDVGDVSVELAFSGWYYLLDWLLTSSTSTTSTVTTTQAKALLVAYNAVNAFYSTSSQDVTASGISDEEYIAPDTSYLQKLEALLSQGNSSNERLAWGIYEDRRLVVAQWAGATPDTVAYRRVLGSGQLYDAADGPVAAWNARPDAICETADLLDIGPVANQADAAARFYVERVVCTIDESGVGLALEPQATDSADAVLARYS